MEEQLGLIHARASHIRWALAVIASIACALAFAGQAQAAAPANDNFASAITLNGDPANASGTTNQATRQAGEPTHGDSDALATVWFKWTPSQTGKVLVDTCDYEDGWVEALGVYTGSAVNALTKVQTGYCRLIFNATSGTTYSIAAVSYTDWSGPFDLVVKSFQAPANDNFSAATELVDGNATGSTLGATSEAGEPDHGESEAESTVWYSWTPSASGTASVNACDGGYNVEVVAVYTGDQVDSLTEKANGYCQLVFAAETGTTYRIAIASYEDFGGDFILKAKIVNSPANDNFAAAANITGFPLAGSTEGATLEAGEPQTEYFDTEATVWYKVSLANTGNFVFDACAEENVQSIAVYSGTSLGNLVERGFSYCRLVVQLTKNTPYYISVGSYSGSWGDFTLKANYFAPVTNDNFGSAVTLTTGAVTAGYNYGAGRQGGEPYHDGADGGRSVWYSWTPAQDGFATVDLCTNFDSVLAVYTGSQLGSLTEVTSDDDSPVSGCSSMSSSVTFDAKANSTYRIAVDGYHESEQGSFNIRAKLGPPRVKHTLTVNRSGNGSGEVYSDPSGIECGQVCSAEFIEGDLVTLFAGAKNGSIFKGWSGPCTGTGSCTVTMSEARNVTADFEREKRKLTVSTNGPGTVTSSPSGIECVTVCEADFPRGSAISLTANPQPGSEFVGWSGACGSATVCTVDLTEDIQVVASFRELPSNPALSLTLTPRVGTVVAGKRANVEVLVTNIGDLAVINPTFCVTVPKAFKKMVKSPACVKVAPLGPGGRHTFTLRIKTTAKAKGKIKLNTALSSANAPTRSNVLILKVKPKKKRR